MHKDSKKHYLAQLSGTRDKIKTTTEYTKHYKVR